MDRREMLKRTAAATAGVVVAPAVVMASPARRRPRFVTRKFAFDETTAESVSQAVARHVRVIVGEQEGAWPRQVTARYHKAAFCWERTPEMHSIYRVDVDGRVLGVEVARTRATKVARDGPVQWASDWSRGSITVRLP